MVYQYNSNTESKGSKGIGLVAAWNIIEAYSSMMNGYALHLLYTYT